MDRREIGAFVRDRLTAVKAINRLPISTLDLFVLRAFLREQDCKTLIEMIELNRKPSRLMSDNPDPSFRTSETCNLDRDSEIVRRVETKLTALLGIAPKYGEILQGQRYSAGQQFKPHHDFLRTTERYWLQQEKIGGQRTWTAMIFLNVPEQGGETYFPLADVKIPPRRGSLVIWNNMDAVGEPNPLTLHQGLPVIAGVKYIITKWYRERPWGVADRTRTASAGSSREQRPASSSPFRN
jgi:prolyl 4-hydroxylase